ncbi:E3 ubiquitin-protein ligase RGLG2-like isoform X1 [Durio zibethinus]|uniref:E3 ubiquitin-protein ligase RGLG2-like isoform X1 n=2 Tax=Durio zibethinus TaxID=66656 RepID=A0A6P5ZDG8_DURZI|nr:E3 ubiquitin-protein ligase RGLG2-like isoform X1 [Durio zibethinus]
MEAVFARNCEFLGLMGGSSSREGSWRQNSSSWNSHYGYPQSSYGQESPSHAPQHSYASPQYYLHSQPEPQYYPPSQQEPQYHPPLQDHGSAKKTIQRRYSRIADNYNSLDQVTEALANAGLESSNLIVGIDFTKSNEWTGKRSFNRKSLHHIGHGLNPYEQAISIIGKTLAAFDEDNLIPCFGFGDASTHDQDVFSFYPDERFCNGFEEVLSRYREIVPHLRLAGPTSFAPIIEMAMTIVEQSGGQYHVLVIIADGQVTRSIDTQRGQLSPQEKKTVDAIVQASKLPLSIILVGVGDGPWDMMKEFDDNIPARAFDNFQFVNFTEIMSKNTAPSRKETEFALAALMEMPSQYKATIELNILGGRKGNVPERVPLPPPAYGAASFNSSKPSYSTSFQYGSASFSSSKPTHPTRFQATVPPYPEDTSPVSSTPPAPSSTYDSQLCPICLSNSKDMAFGCGHQTCEECSKDLETCPICRSPIQTKIKLYF